MKKNVTLTAFLLMTLLIAQAQSWNVYTGKVLPNLNIPAFSENSVTLPAPIDTILPNPEQDGDSIYSFISYPKGAKFLWKYDFPAAVPNVTLVTRLKGISDTLDRVMEIDMQNGAFRERIVIKNDNSFELKQSGFKGSFPANVMDWHMIRFTMKNDSAFIYLDEQPDPVAAVKTPTSTTNKYFRLGDNDGNSTTGALIDWIIWDETGCYAPDQGAAIPDSLVQRKAGWKVYTARVLPSENNPAFATSNVSGTYTNTLLDDPDHPENSLLKLIAHPAASKFMWKYNWPADESPAVTMVARVKGVSDTLDRVMEFDFEHFGTRERLYVKTNNTWELKESGTTGTMKKATGWHIYRITKEKNLVNVYLDENPVPLATVIAPTTTTNKWFRFGDGNSGSSLGGVVDWIIWDESGAYAPKRGYLIPDSLIQEVVSGDALLATLTANTGTLSPAFDPDITEYTLKLPAGSSSVTIDATAHHAKATVTGTGEYTSFPTDAEITVTAEDGTTKTYTISISVLSNDATLAALTPGSGILSPEFDPEITEYVLKLPAGSTSVTLEATPNDAKATVTGTGEFSAFPVDAVIKVTAEDGTIKEYVVTIMVLSNDASLASLTASEGTLSPEFDPEITSYTLELPSGTTSVTLTATPNDNKASVEGDGEITTLPADITITVTAEDGTTATYMVHILLTGIRENGAGKFSLYPNPAREQITVTLPSAGKLTLKNTLGQTLIARNCFEPQVTVDLKDIKTGIYFLTFENADFSVTMKVVRSE